MCRNCIAEVMLDLAPDELVTDEQWASIEWPASTPEMERLTELVQRLYGFSTCSVGGPLHIVTDDFNLEDDHLDSCDNDIDAHWSLIEAAPHERIEIAATAREIITLMRPMTLRERAVALGRTHGMVPASPPSG